MIEVGAFDAKTHLSSLLDKVTRGKKCSSPDERSRRPARSRRASGMGEDRKRDRGPSRAPRGSEAGRPDWKKLRDDGRR